MRKVVLALTAALVMGCTPVTNTRGYLPDPDAVASIGVGKDTKTSIQQRLGYPSTTATFAGDAWYYISSVEKEIAFFRPTVKSRAILAVYFDKDGKVTGIKRYSLSDGHVVDFETRQTPTKGRELTFLQQLFNATPGVPLGGSGGGGPGGGSPNPGGGGGPPGGGSYP